MPSITLKRSPYLWQKFMRFDLQHLNIQINLLKWHIFLIDSSKFYAFTSSWRLPHVFKIQPAQLSYIKQFIRLKKAIYYRYIVLRCINSYEKQKRKCFKHHSTTLFRGKTMKQREIKIAFKQIDSSTRTRLVYNENSVNCNVMHTKKSEAEPEKCQSFSVTESINV